MRVSGPIDESLVAATRVSHPTTGDHRVQFYDDDHMLVATTSRQIGEALASGNGALVIARQSLRESFERCLEDAGIDVSVVRRSGQYVVLDATDALAEFMVDGWPDEQRFSNALGEQIANLAARHQKVFAFGEMVALLWADGKADAAIALERLWNELGKRLSFSLCCAYPLDGFAHHTHSAAFLQICAAHSKVIPATGGPEAGKPDDHDRVVAELQQKTLALRAEIEEHKKTCEMLLRRESELSDFLEQGTECLHQVGPDGRILWANRTELELLGYARDEYIGHSICEFHADEATIHEILDKLTRGQTLQDFPARLRCKNGDIKDVRINSSVRWEDGKFVSTRCFTRDVTERTRLTEALQEKLEALTRADCHRNEFLAMLGHELRNPLSPILSALQILHLPDANAPAVRAAVDTMDHQTRHLARIVDDLLDVTRISTGKIELRNELVDLSAVIRRAVDMTSHLTDAMRHQVSLDLPAERLFVRGDVTRLEQAVANLLTNASKYMPANGRIRINAVLRGENIEVTIADQGIGISAALLPGIFELFTQAERSLDRAQGGLGIGLWMVRKVVHLHGGTIDAHSEGIGKGSTFVLTLPKGTREVGAGEIARETDRPPQPGPASHRILIVDDNRDGADLLAMLLRMSGHVVEVVHDGSAALQLASTFDPQVVLLDIGLPGRDGYSVARALRQETGGEQLQIIAITGYGQEEQRRRSREAGFNLHLVKPIDSAKLCDLLSRPMAEIINHRDWSAVEVAAS